MTCGGIEGQRTTAGFQEIQFWEAAATHVRLPATRCCLKVREENAVPPSRLTGLPLRGRF